MPRMTAAIPSLEIPAIAELASKKQWVCWRLAERDGKPTKEPVQSSGFLASTTNPATWSTYKSCTAALVEHPDWGGVGYVFNGVEWGCDLDKIKEQATIEPWALEIVRRFRTYTEVSPSGKGLHLIGTGALPVDGARKGQVEIYRRGRFFTFTGDHLDGTPDTIEHVDDDAIDWFWAVHIKKAVTAAQSSVDISNSALPFDKFDTLMTNSDTFRATWLHKRGDLRDQSMSALDFSLAVQASEAGWNDGELAALVMHHRAKWGGQDKAQRQDYLQRTVANVHEVLRNRSEGRETLARAMGRVIAREHAEEVREGGQDAALQELRRRLDMPIAHVMITGEQSAHAYSLILDDGRRIELGSAGKVLDQRTLREAAFAHAGKVVPQVKQPVWDATIMILQAASDREAAGDSDPVQELLDAVAEYAERALPWEAKDSAISFADGRPVVKDGLTHVTTRSLAKWLDTTGLRYDTVRVRSLLRQAGWTCEKLTRRVNNTVLGRVYWSGECNRVTPQEGALVTPQVTEKTR